MCFLDDLRKGKSKKRYMFDFEKKYMCVFLSYFIFLRFRDGSFRRVEIML